MTDAASAPKKNWPLIIGSLILSVGLMLANFGCTVSMAGQLGAMDAAQYYVLVNALGSLGMMLILPIVGRLTGIFGMRNLILLGIVVQCAGRVLMMAAGTWIPYALGYLIQALGGGCFTTAAYVLLAMAVPPAETPKFFGYNSVAIAVGSMLGPILVSTMSAMGGKMFQWASAPSLILMAAAVVSLVVVIRRELTIDNPAIPLRMFKNRRLTHAFLGSMCSSVFSTCVASYTIMWVMYNFSAFPGAVLFNGTASIMSHIVNLVLGLFLGGYVGKKFVMRFRPFGIAAAIASIIATGMLFCLRFTGTAAAGNVMAVGNMPVGMILIYVACAIGGFTMVVANSTYSAYWQSNTPRDEIPSGQAMYSFGAMMASCFFGALVGVLMGTSGDYTIAFGAACVICVLGLVNAIVGFKFTPEEIAAAQK